MARIDMDGLTPAADDALFASVDKASVLAGIPKPSKETIDEYESIYGKGSWARVRSEMADMFVDQNQRMLFDAYEKEFKAIKPVQYVSDAFSGVTMVKPGDKERYENEVKALKAKYFGE